MKPRVFLPVLFLFCRLAFADTQKLYDQLQATLQDQNQTAYLQLIIPNPEVQAEEKTFFAEYLGFHPVKTVMNKAEPQDNLLRVQIMMQAKEEARFELWSLHTQEVNGKTLISQRDVISSVDGLY